MTNSMIRPDMSLAPILMEAISRPGTDPLANKIVTALGPQAPVLAGRWAALSPRLKHSRFLEGQPQPWLQNVGQQDLTGKLTAFAQSYDAARKQMIATRRKQISEEFDRSMSDSVLRRTPPSWFTQDKIMAAEYGRYRASQFGENGCRCEKPTESAAPPPNPTRYGVVTKKLKCYDQCESGHDEVYLVSVAVDGNGRYTQSVSPIYRIDDDDNDVLYPHHWIYPLQPPNGYLDVAIQMMEDDGGYDGISSAFTTFGGVVQAIGGAIANPVVAGAGLAIVIIGTLISVLGNFDTDDNYGIQIKTWGSAATVNAAPGVYLMSFTGKDWRGDRFSFDLTIQVACA